MDDIDTQLLTLLRHNGRRSISDLAQELGLSRATVRARIERMENRGDIVGYTVILRADAIAMPVRGIILIEVEGRAADRIVDMLGGFPEMLRSIRPTASGTLSLSSACRALPISTWSFVESG